MELLFRRLLLLFHNLHYSTTSVLTHHNTLPSSFFAVFCVCLVGSTTRRRSPSLPKLYAAQTAQKVLLRVVVFVVGGMGVVWYVLISSTLPYVR